MPLIIGELLAGARSFEIEDCTVGALLIVKIGGDTLPPITVTSATTTIRFRLALVAEEEVEVVQTTPVPVGAAAGAVPTVETVDGEVEPAPRRGLLEWGKANAIPIMATAVVVLAFLTVGYGVWSLTGQMRKAEKRMNEAVIAQVNAVMTARGGAPAPVDVDAIKAEAKAEAIAAAKAEVAGLDGRFTVLENTVLGTPRVVTTTTRENGIAQTLEAINTSLSEIRAALDRKVDK